MKSRTAQAWALDLMIASVIFMSGLIVFFLYVVNNPYEGELNVQNLYYDGKVVGDSILSQGYPRDWNSSQVVTPGILSEDKVNETKLGRFFNLSTTEYNRTRSLFNTQYNYYFFFAENMTLNSQEVEGIGLKPANAKNLIKISRFTAYKNKPTTVYIYIWN